MMGREDKKNVFLLISEAYLALSQRSMMELSCKDTKAAIGGVL